MSRGWLILLLLLTMVAAYHMPWMLHKTAAFTLNAFDLAEGASLHPTVRAESPPLFTPLRLRLSLLLVSVLIVIAATQLPDERWRWIWRGVAILTVLRLNPPTDFYPLGGNDDNYNQLGYLMVGGLGLIAALIILGRFVKPLAQPLLLVGLIVTLYSAISGYRSAIHVFDSIGLAVEMGGGLMIFIGAIVASGGVSVWGLSEQVGLSKLKRQSAALPFQKA